MIKRLSGESYDDFLIRLFEHKDEYRINCQEIADILNAEYGRAYKESTYRKYYAAFNKGRIYEREKRNSGVKTRILSLSDFHHPFSMGVSTYKDYVGCVDILVLNGDLQDCQGISSFTKKYRIPFVEEMIATRQYIIDVIELIHPKKVIINKGNHEQRLLRYMSERLNEDILSLMPDSSLDLIVNEGFKNNDRYAKTTVWYEPIKNVFDDIEVEYTGDWHCKVGKTIFAHPSASSSAMLKTTEKAVTFFLKTDRDFDCCVLAHTHKLGSYIQGGVYMFEQGCCCDVSKLDYADGKLQNPQQQGFIYLCQDKDGSLLYENTKLISLTDSESEK